MEEEEGMSANRMSYFAVGTVLLLLVAVPAFGAVITVGPTGDYATIQAAVAAANVSGDVIHVAPGTYVEAGQIVLAKNVAIIGDALSKPVVMTDSDTGSGGDARAWWLVQPGYTVTLENLVLDGTGYLVYQGIRAHGGGVMNNCDMKNILYNESGPSYSGVAIVFFGTQNWTVTNNTFENIGRIGIFGYGAGITGSTINGNTYTGNKVTAAGDDGMQVTADNNTVEKNQFLKCTDHGVVVQQGAGNVFEKNKALKNEDDDMWTDVPVGDNTWTKNKYKTGNIDP